MVTSAEQYTAVVAGEEGRKVNWKIILFILLGVVIIAVVIIIILFAFDRTMIITEAEILEGKNVDLTEGQKINFVVDEKVGEHSLIVEVVGEDSVTLVFRSDLVRVTLKIGEEKQVDLNGDGVNDITVKLEKIEKSKPYLNIRKISRNTDALVNGQGDGVNNGGSSECEAQGGIFCLIDQQCTTGSRYIGKDDALCCLGECFNPGDGEQELDCIADPDERPVDGCSSACDICYCGMENVQSDYQISPSELYRMCSSFGDVDCHASSTCNSYAWSYYNFHEAKLGEKASEVCTVNSDVYYCYCEDASTSKTVEDLAKANYYCLENPFDGKAEWWNVGAGICGAGELTLNSDYCLCGGFVCGFSIGYNQCENNICSAFDGGEMISCVLDSDCNDNNPCTTDVCGLAGVSGCGYNEITSCKTFSDGCCPTGCDGNTDSDCEGSVKTCSDGTPKGTCLSNKPEYCYDNLVIGDSCGICGCPLGKECGDPQTSSCLVPVHGGDYIYTESDFEDAGFDLITNPLTQEVTQGFGGIYLYDNYKSELEDLVGVVVNSGGYVPGIVEDRDYGVLGFTVLSNDEYGDDSVRYTGEDVEGTEVRILIIEKGQWGIEIWYEPAEESMVNELATIGLGRI